MDKQKIKKKVNQYISKFKVGDRIKGFIAYSGSETEGIIAKINGQTAQMKTKWGEFTVSLSTATKLA